MFQGGRRLLALPGQVGTCCLLAIERGRPDKQGRV